VKLVHLLGFITKNICYDTRSHERKTLNVIYTHLYVHTYGMF